MPAAILTGERIIERLLGELREQKATNRKQSARITALEAERTESFHELLKRSQDRMQDLQDRVAALEADCGIHQPESPKKRNLRLVVSRRQPNAKVL